MFRVMFLISILLSLFLGISSCGNNSVQGNSPLTVLSIVEGNVLVQKTGASDWSHGNEGMILQAGNKIKTDNGGKATITFFDGSIIELSENTEISLDELTSKSPSSLKTIKIGQTIGETTNRIIKLVDPASRYEIETPSGVAAVRGSTMVVKVVADGTTNVYNVEGTISFTAQGKEVMIPVGSSSTAKPGEIPSTPQPGLPTGIGSSSITSISSRTGWQQTGLQLNAGDKFYVDYRGGSWTVDYKNFPYVGLGGYSSDIDKTVAAGYKFNSSVSYCYLLGKVGNGKVILVGNQGGPFTADVNGFLSLRINDIDSSLGDNDGAITVALRVSTVKNSVVKGSLRQNPPSWDVPAATEASGGNATIQADGMVNVSLVAGTASTTYGVFLEEYKGTTGGAENYLSWWQIGSLTTDTNGMGTFSSTISLSAGTHYLQIVLSIDGSWGSSAFGTDISKIIIK